MTQASEQPSAPRVETRGASIDGRDALLNACGVSAARSAKVDARAAQLDALGIKAYRPARHAPCFAQSATILKT